MKPKKQGGFSIHDPNDGWLEGGRVFTLTPSPTAKLALGWMTKALRLVAKRSLAIAGASVALAAQQQRETSDPASHLKSFLDEHNSIMDSEAGIAARLVEDV